MVASLYQHERRLLWHPRQDNKFVVGGGTQISLFQWAPDQPEIQHITSQHDFQSMKCFAWSPDPAFDDLLAVGQSNGRVDLLRLGATKVARKNVLSSGPVVSLITRNPRACYALAFSTIDPNYLAVGLDRLKGDPSLVVWDVSLATPALRLDAGLSATPSPHPSSSPRADMSSRTDARILQQHVTSEMVSSLAFLPHSANLLLAGISQRSLRLFDLRATTPVNTVQSKVHGIATDTLDPRRFACFDERTITVWDTRRLPSPLLTFTERDALADGAMPRLSGAYSNIEFSSVRRGTLATLGKEGSYVRFWDLQSSQATRSTLGRSTDVDRSRENHKGPRIWANLPWTTLAHNQPSPGDMQQSSPSYLILSDTRKTKLFNRPLASFAFVPSAQRHPLATHVMVVDREGDLELCTLHDAPKQVVWSARGELCLSAGQTLRIFPGIQPPEPPRDSWRVPDGSISRAAGRSVRDGNISQTKKESLAPPSQSPYAGDPTKSPIPSTVPLTSLAPQQHLKAMTRSPSSSRTYRVGAVDLTIQPPNANEPTHEGPRHPTERPLREKLGARGRKPIPNHVVEHDISMLMYKRTIQGYQLCDLLRNLKIAQLDPDDEVLSDLWWWINNSQELFSQPTAKIHGYDFSCQGLLGIWEGLKPMPNPFAGEPIPTSALFLTTPVFDALPSRESRSRSTVRTKHSAGSRSLSPMDAFYGDFEAAASAVVARRGLEATLWKSPAVTSKLAQRQLALQLCGWSLKEEELNANLKRWEKEGKQSRAACWLVFTRQYSRAVELLMRSKDESHHMMSGMLSVLTPSGHSAADNPELREQCERLIVRLHDPYFRAFLTYLTSNDWSEVLEEEALPFRERLAIAFQFLDDKSLTSYLRRMKEECCAWGDIQGIIVTGLTPMGMDILQSYVDHTGDVQTAAILSSLVSPGRFEDPRASRWLDAYRDLLDGFKLFHHRVSFDIERGRIMQEAVQEAEGGAVSATWVPKQILIRCNYCSENISAIAAAKQDGKPTACPNCDRSLPRCSICLLTLGIVQDSARNAELARSQYHDTIDDAIVICQTCRHGGHASHVIDWFFGQHGDKSHGVCPVADCACRCGNEM